MTNEELFDIFRFDEDVESIEITSIENIPGNGEHIIARLHYPDGDMDLPVIHYAGKDWVFTPLDWQGWLPFKKDEISETKWRVNNTGTEAEMYNGYPVLAPWTDEPEALKNNARFAIGKQIRDAREAAGLSQRALAEKAGLGYSHIARIELGRYNVTIDTLAVIANALGCKITIN